MNGGKYFDTLCESELENVALLLSSYPHCEEWGRDRSIIANIKNYIHKSNPLRVACGSLIPLDLTRELSLITLLTGADLIKNVNFQSWKWDELMENNCVQTFADLSTSLNSVGFNCLRNSKVVETWHKRLMETIGKRLMSISAHYPSAWMLRNIEDSCINIQSLLFSCVPSEVSSQNFWEKVGPRLQELEIRFWLGYADDSSYEESHIRHITRHVQQYCQHLTSLSLSGPRSCKQNFAECIGSFPQLETTRIRGPIEVEHSKLIADRCIRIRVGLILYNERTAGEIINCFGDRVDTLQLSGHVLDEGADSSELEHALNTCSTIKKFRSESLTSMSILCTKPKRNLQDFTIWKGNKKMQIPQVFALARSTGNLRKFNVGNITSATPISLWKEFFNANIHLESVEMGFSFNFDLVVVDESGSEDELELELDISMLSYYFAEILKLMVPLQNLRIVNLLSLNTATENMDEIIRMRDACLKLRHRKIHVAVNDFVLLPYPFGL